MTDALAAWGAYDRDDPFPLFAEVRALGAVHEVTLADGHDAWLVVRHDEARAALNDLAALEGHARGPGDGRRRSWPRVCPDRRSPGTCSSSIRPITPDCAGWSRPPSRFARIEALRPRVQAIVDDLLDGVAAQGPDSRVDLVARFAFPLPFTVICELLGVPELDRDRPRAGLTGCSPPRRRRASTPRRSRRPTRSWRC